MSALTDLFSAMANKIRSKTGTATTYTPSEMVSDGIDDVYDAGVASATTPITPSNSSPASMTANTGYKPTANGYAISSYDSVTPSSTPESVASGDIVKIGGSGVIVDSVPTPTSLTPSNSSPATITSGTLYSATANGKAVASVTDVTPSDSTPPSISSGDIIKSSASGYLYATQQSGGMTETTLWENSDPTASMGAKTLITDFNSKIDSYDYLKFIWRTSTTDSTEMFIIVSVTEYKATGSGNGNMITMSTQISGIRYARQVYNDAGDLRVLSPVRLGSSGTQATAAIITKIKGIKV